MAEKETKKSDVECPMCGGFETEKVKTGENSYGVFVTIYLCRDCDVEYEIQVKY